MHGFGLPTSKLFHDLLRYYQTELVHLNLNSIMHIAIFAHLCELCSSSILALASISLQPTVVGGVGV